MRAQEFITEGAGQKPIIIYTNNRGATIDDDIKKSLPVTPISFDQLRQWESHKSMKDPKVADWVNNKLLPELKQNGILKPLLVWNNNGEFFVIDGNHRFIAYQEAGYRGRVPVQIVPDSMITVSDTMPGQQGMAENKAAGINKMFNNLGDPVYANLQRVALLAMQGRQQEAAGRLQTVIKHADPAVQKKITDAVNSIKPVTINGRVADSSILDKSKQHNDWITNTFIPWVQSLLGQQGVAEGKQPGQPVVDAILKVMPIAQEIWFHGSRATGKHSKNSDTDILVVVPDDLVGDQYLGVVRILQKLSSHFDNYDIQPTHPGYNIHLIAQEEGRLLWSNKQDMAEDESNDTAISLSKLGKFHPGADTLAEFVPERATAQYALHPDKWESTFYSLTNKDSDKLKYYGPKKISIPPGTLVGDMAIANKFYRAKTPEEQEQYAELYKASLQPYPVDVSKYRMPELLIPKQDMAENFADGKNPGRKGLAKRSGVNTKASVSSLRKTAKNSSGEKQRMAHWLANMKAGRAKAKRK